MNNTADPAPPVVLASASRIRATLLRDAGVEFTVHPARVDEDEVKTTLRAEGASAADCAATLAEFKARRVSARHPQALVVGADQMLECDGVWFDKPPDRSRARASLGALRGRRHHLPTAVCVFHGGAPIWRHDATAELEMRAFSDAFLETYLDAAGADAFASVGAYRLEGMGAQLFSRIDGEYFTILGLPLLPLLDFLRNHRVVAT